MKNFQEHLLVESLWDNYGVILCTLNVKPDDDENDLTKQINELMDSAFTQYQVIRISAVEKYNAEGAAQAKKNRQTAEDRALKNALSELQKKENILNKSDKYQQSWIKRKVETDMRRYDKDPWNMHFKEITNKTLSKSDVKISYGWHNDIFGHEYALYEQGRYNNFVEEAVKYIKKHDGIEQIIVTCKDFLDRNGHIHFSIFPKFNDEIETKNSNLRKKWGGYIASEYNSGKYMGD